MSDATPGPPRTGAYRPRPGRQRAHRPLSITGLPSDEDVASQPHTGEAADRFTLWTPEQIEAETRTVRLDISFREALKVRDQAEMIIAAMRLIIEKTREHDIGSIRQRIEARREADSLRRVLARFNGKVPHGDSAKKKPIQRQHNP